MALTIQMGEIKRMVSHVEQGMEKCITEGLAEQNRKHNEELNMLKQSQVATNNLSTSHNSTRFLSYNSAEQYKNMTKANNVIFDGKPKNWQRHSQFPDHGRRHRY
jgi:hypothetical protein